MEIKKAKKFDLERNRPLRLSLSFISIVILCALLFSMPLIISSVMKGLDKWDDEMIEDLTLDLKEDDEMIAAVQTEVQDEVTEIIKPVETLTESAELDNTDMEATKEEISEKDSEEDENQPTEEMVESKDAKPIDRSDPEDLLIAETLPEFPGGMSEFVTWLTKNLKYPNAARNRNIQGLVSISFVIEKDGSLTDIKVAQAANPLLDREALRVAKMMPKWKPGKQNGKPCRTLFAIPIEFKL